MWVGKSMGNRAEQFSRGTIESGGTRRIRHSMNQKVLKGMKERQGKYSRPMDKVIEAASRRERIQRSEIEFQEMLALEEQRRGLIEKDNQATTTIVDFNSRNK